LGATFIDSSFSQVTENDFVSRENDSFAGEAKIALAHHDWPALGDGSSLVSAHTIRHALHHMNAHTPATPTVQRAITLCSISFARQVKYSFSPAWIRIGDVVSAGIWPSPM
jgi:hypothetical protein